MAVMNIKGVTTRKHLISQAIDRYKHIYKVLTAVTPSAVLGLRDIYELSGTTFGATSCELCKHYANMCMGCPVYMYTGSYGCVATPYSKLHDSIGTVTIKRLLPLIYDEIVFLEKVQSSSVCNVNGDTDD